MSRPGLAPLLVAALAALAVLAPLLAPGGSGRTSDDRGPEGTAALSAVYSGLGYEVRSFRLGRHALRSIDAPALLIAPAPSGLLAHSIDAADAARLIAVAEAGSTVVVLADRFGALGEELAATTEGDPPDVPFDASPVWPSRWTAAPTLRMRATPLSLGEGAIPLYGDGASVFVALVPRGSGRLLLVSDPDLASNRPLGRNGAVDFFAGVARAAVPDGGVVVFDDGGGGGAEQAGLVAWARSRGLLPTLLLAALVLALVALRVASPIASPAPPEDDPALPGTAVQLATLGGLYARASLFDYALELLSRQFRSELRERFRGDVTDASLPSRVERERGPEAAAELRRLSSAFRSALADRPAAARTVLRLARDVARFERDVLFAPRRAN